jgi:hypothetical protein
MWFGHLPLSSVGPPSHAAHQPGDKVTEIAGQLRGCFGDLASWMRARRWLGSDPYDLQSLRIYRITREAPWPLNRISSRFWHLLERKAPYAARRVLGVNLRPNAFTFALVARAHLMRATGTNERSSQPHLEEAREVLQWLVDHPGIGTGKAKLGWGYPFTWYAGRPDNCTVIAPDTPLGVVSNEAGFAFLDWLDATGDDHTLRHAEQVGRFLISELNRYEGEKGELCFSYGPTDTFQVINTTLGVAAFLTRLSAYNSSGELREIARRARLYARSRQHSDGSWGYWGDETGKGRIDHYHTGMNLQWLGVCQRHDPIEEDAESLRRGSGFYMEEMFALDGAPRMTPDSLYPINIHSCAQAMVTLHCLHETGSERALHQLQKTCSWTLENMRNPDGSFGYAVWRRCKDRTPHMRWGQAWMLWGLANAISAFETAENTCHNKPVVARPKTGPG